MLISCALMLQEELWVDTPNVTYSYIIRPGTVQDRSGLSEAMQELCQGTPIRIIEEDAEDPDEVEIMENGLRLLPRPPKIEGTENVSHVNKLNCHKFINIPLLLQKTKNTRQSEGSVRYSAHQQTRNRLVY